MTSTEQSARVLALVESGRSAEAMQLLREAVAQDPFDYEALHSLAILSLESGDLAAGRDAIERALLIRPDSVEYLIVRAETSRRAGRLAAARTDLETALAAEPRNHEALTSAGLVEGADGNYAAAESLFLRAIESRGDYVDAIYSLARLKARTGDLADSERWLARARQLQPLDKRFQVAPSQLSVPPVVKAAAPPASPPQRDATDPAYAALEAALRAGTIVPVADAKILGSPLSPIYSATDANRLFAPLAALAAAALWFMPLTEGMVAAVAFIAIYHWTVPLFVARKLARRIARTEIVADPAAWSRLWKVGGLVLQVPATGRRVQAPDQDWRDALGN